MSSWLVKEIPASDFDPTAIKFNGSIPTSKNYKVYLFEKHKKYKKDFRVYVCMHTDCQHFHSNLNKFFDHLRSHTKEKPFRCSHGCDKSFSQIGNLKKHIEDTHLSIKRFECYICGKRFSKRFNLDIHLKSEKAKRQKQ